jgi:hypothetical protein
MNGNGLKTTGAGGRGLRAPAPESIEQPALAVDDAASLMGELGFVAFRTPSEAAGTDSCLMVMIRDAPTRRHFDPETVSYWVLRSGHGARAVLDQESATPVSRGYSWGRIRLEDRFGARNEFVSFGGWLNAERVGDDALLLIFRSPAPILRLGGHSQQRDHLADDAVAFFSRIVPQTWASAAEERLIGSYPPESLWAAFLLYEQARMSRSASLREADAEDAHALNRELEIAGREQPAALADGRLVLTRLGLLQPGR